MTDKIEQEPQPKIIDLRRLAAHFPPDAISWRVGPVNSKESGKATNGIALAYLDARDVQDRLDAVCGPENWQVRHPWSVGNKLACEIGVRVDDEWIWKGDGAGESDMEAEKGAFSDSFKRAAVRFGIGRYLYDIDSPWVEIEPMGKSYKIKESEKAKLRQVLVRAAGGQDNASQAPAESPGPKPVETQTPPNDKKAALKALAKEIRDAALLAKDRAALDNLLKIRSDDLRSIKAESERLYLWIMEAVSQKDKTFAKVA